MNITTKYNRFRLISLIKKSITDILPNIKSTNTYLYASTHLDRGGNPVVIIDSTLPVIGILLKFNKDSIEIKSLVNRSSLRGKATIILDKILSNLPDGMKIIISQDVSDGFWNSFIKRYPNFYWIFS
jgi:hypothetical protein